MRMQGGEHTNFNIPVTLSQVSVLRKIKVELKHRQFNGYSEK
jgi:hypothetical protein